ncbi:MAG: hypothetical protein P8Y36_07790, partial [Alphaproteobacteria bacterium]
MILSIPWLVIIVVIYNLIAFTMSWEAATPDAVVPIAGPFSTELFSINMISGARWALTLGDVVIVIALLLLFV